MITEFKIMVIAWSLGFVLRWLNKAIREESEPIEILRNIKTLNAMDNAGVLLYLLTFLTFIWWLL